MKTETTQVERAPSACSDSTPDTTRRDALARNLCARLCGEMRTEEDLEQVDSLLTELENGVDANTLLGRLLHDRYNEGEGTETDRIFRRGHNAGMRHATALVRIHQGLTELRRQSSWPGESPSEQLFPFDLGGES